MTFRPDQIAALQAPLDRKVVKEREQAGRKLSYIEAWQAIAEANRIFGFDAWNRETVEMRQLGETRCVQDKYGKDQFRVGYMAKVRIVVWPPIDEGGFSPSHVIREGTGFGSGFDKDPDQAHESAIKEAESDAMKRALMTFGNPFGLALYDKTQANVQNVPVEPRKAPGAIETGEQPPRDRGPSEPGAKDWWGAEGPGMTANQAKKDGFDDRHEQMRSQIDTLKTAQEWKDWCAENTADIKLMPRAWREILRTEAEEVGKFLGAIQ